MNVDFGNLLFIFTFLYEYDIRKNYLSSVILSFLISKNKGNNNSEDEIKKLM